jgi:hypothetical protein
MNGMTGVFTQEVLSQIAGQSTAPLAGATSAPATSKATTATTTSKPSTSSPTSTNSTAHATTTNGALNVKAGWFGVVVGAVVGVAMF